ncbi:Tubulin beta 8 [Hibiscus syriacus]|uniref:Tubulin beta 8 n=1 Tax=Hibiscus syriacus TaxID=106335 RepID=A0A6A2YNV6_HIBSY|nr:Tubulin beta 8 [Hibiscus syriacus]
MGFDNECILNIQSLAGEYFCPVCRLLVYPNEALQSQRTHLYCKPCLTYVVSTTRACPYDGYLVTEVDSKVSLQYSTDWFLLYYYDYCFLPFDCSRHIKLQPLVESNKALAETIGKITVHCLYHRSGCTWQGPLSECTTHCSGCAFGNSHVVCNRCGVQIVHHQVQEHAQNCPRVQPQAQQIVSGQEISTSGITSDQIQVTSQVGTTASQAQTSQTTTSSTSVHDLSQPANPNPQSQVVSQVAVVTSEHCLLADPTPTSITGPASVALICSGSCSCSTSEPGASQSTATNSTYDATALSNSSSNLPNIFGPFPTSGSTNSSSSAASAGPNYSASSATWVHASLSTLSFPDATPTAPTFAWSSSSTSFTSSTTGRPASAPTPASAPATSSTKPTLESKFITVDTTRCSPGSDWSSILFAITASSEFLPSANSSNADTPVSFCNSKPTTAWFVVFTQSYAATCTSSFCSTSTFSSTTKSYAASNITYVSSIYAASTSVNPTVGLGSASNASTRSFCAATAAHAISISPPGPPQFFQQPAHAYQQPHQNIAESNIVHPYTMPNLAGRPLTPSHGLQSQPYPQSAPAMLVKPMQLGANQPSYQNSVLKTNNHSGLNSKPVLEMPGDHGTLHVAEKEADLSSQGIAKKESNELDLSSNLGADMVKTNTSKSNADLKSIDEKSTSDVGDNSGGFRNSTNVTEESRHTDFVLQRDTLSKNMVKGEAFEDQKYVDNAESKVEEDKIEDGPLLKIPMLQDAKFGEEQNGKMQKDRIQHQDKSTAKGPAGNEFSGIPRSSQVQPSHSVPVVDQGRHHPQQMTYGSNNNQQKPAASASGPGQTLVPPENFVDPFGRGPSSYGPQGPYNQGPVSGAPRFPRQGEYLNPFPLDHAQRFGDRGKFDEDLKQFSRPSHLDSGPAPKYGSYFSSSRSLDRGPLDFAKEIGPWAHEKDSCGLNFDPMIDSGPSRFLRPYHLDDAGERPVGSDYSGISSHRFEGRPSDEIDGRERGFDDRFSDTRPPHFIRGENFGHHNMPGQVRMEGPIGFGEFSSHEHMGDFDGSGNFRQPRLGEPGFRSSYSLREFPNDGGIYTGDMDSFENLIKRKPASMGWCRICKVDCETVEGLDMHSQTREHQKMAMDMVVIIKQNAKKLKQTSSDHSLRNDSNKSKKAKFESRSNKIKS